MPVGAPLASRSTSNTENGRRSSGSWPRAGLDHDELPRQRRWRRSPAPRARARCSRPTAACSRSPPRRRRRASAEYQPPRCIVYSGIRGSDCSGRFGARIRPLPRSQARPQSLTRHRRAASRQRVRHHGRRARSYNAAPARPPRGAMRDNHECPARIAQRSSSTAATSLSQSIDSPVSARGARMPW